MISRASRLRPLAIAAALLSLATSGATLRAFQNQAPDRIDVLIAFRTAPGVGDEQFVRGLGGQVRYRYAIVPGIAASVPQAAVTALLNNPRVASVDPDGLVFAIGDFASELAYTWGVEHIGGGEAHLAGAFGTGVKVAVIDSGIDMDHAELSGRYMSGYDFVNGDGDPFDDNSHGTHVSGTIAAIRNGEQVVGVAPEASLYAYKVLNASGSGNWSNIIAALEQAIADGIQVTNNSYGSGSYPGGLVEQAFAESAAAGILHIASAGNSGNCAAKGNSVGYPARFPTVVAVAATNSSDVRPCFSSTGPDVELSAPGVSIRSTVPNGGYAVYNGTSMASPHVTGTAALMFGADPTITADEVRQLLIATAIDLGATGRDASYGFGLVNAEAAVSAAAAGGGSSGGGGGTGGGGTEPPISSIVVQSVDYSRTGGRNSDRHLVITIAIVDDTGAALAGASVTAAVALDGAPLGTQTGTTDTNGRVAFQIKNAPIGCYVTTVTSVTAGGTTLDYPPMPGGASSCAAS